MWYSWESLNMLGFFKRDHHLEKVWYLLVIISLHSPQNEASTPHSKTHDMIHTISSNPSNIEWDRIPTDPVKSKLRSSYKILRFFRGPFSPVGVRETWVLLEISWIQNSTHIFQKGWFNHQLVVYIFFCFFPGCLWKKWLLLCFFFNVGLFLRCWKADVGCWIRWRISEPTFGGSFTRQPWKLVFHAVRWESDPLGRKCPWKNP